MAVQQKLHSASELLEISARVSGRQRLELVKGEIREMSPASGGHGEVALEIGALIRNYVREHKLGRMTAAETGYILARNPDTVRAPDVGFIAMERAPEPLSAGYIPFAPDLAVEVVSPGDTASEIHAKVRSFLGAGTRLLWVIYPDTKTVEVHTPAGAHTLEADATLDGGDVLPGFAIMVNAIFPD